MLWVKKIHPILAIAFVFFSFQQVSAGTISIPEDHESIQAGIETANAGDTVLVAPGTYHERIILKREVIVRGSKADSTILDGSGEGDVVIGANQSELSGFTITNSGPAHCAIRCQGTSPIIRENRIIRNGVGIICLEGAQPNIAFNIVTRCDDGSDFGTIAVHCDRSSPMIVNNTISNNCARFAVYCDSSFPVIKNNIITNNWGGIGCFNDAAPALSYNNVWNNRAFGDYDGCEPGEGSISQDPLFVDIAADDYRLDIDSPSIGAGDPADESPVRPRVDLGAVEYRQP